MAKIFDHQYGTSVTQVWLAAAAHLLMASHREDCNLLLEVEDPLAAPPEDQALLHSVDAALRSANTDLTLSTVAETIFPHSMYRRHGRPEMYKHVIRALDRGRKRSTWGTYAERMISRPLSDGINTMNPLEIMIEKLKANAKAKSAYRSTYELNVADPEIDLVPLPCEFDDDGGDIPTYNPEFDARRLYGGPCLSNVSFKLIGSDTVNLTAVYRSHHYCSRALGNLIGLARLLNFVATEAELAVGTLTCLSTFATLDVEKWGGIEQARKILTPASNQAAA